MPLEVSVTTDPLIVYAVVAVLLGSVVAALVFSRPRRGLGAARSSDARATPGSELPWMPGTDIFERPEQSPPPSQAGPSGVQDQWSTGSSGATPPRDKR